MFLPVTKIGTDGEDEFRPSDPGALGEIGGRRGVRDAHNAASGEDDPEVDSNRLRGHRKVECNAVARFRAEGVESVRHPGGEAMQFAVGDMSKLRNGLGRAYNRRLPRFRAEAALRDVQSRPRQPIRVHRIRVWLKDGFGLGSEHDAEALDHGRPEFGTVLGRPTMEVRI